MPILTSRQALTIGLFGAPLIFAVAAYFTRATARRLLGAVAGAVAYAAVAYAWDQVALARGWWSYPAWLGTGRVPLAVYVLAGLVGGAFGLVGWRVIRSWGWLGLAGWPAPSRPRPDKRLGLRWMAHEG